MKENSIEEDIKIIRSIDTLDDFELGNAINHILSDYKRVLKENEELNKKLKIKIGDIEYMQNKINNHFVSDVEIQENFIPVQKVKDKIEELNKKILDAERFDERILKYRYQKQVLQELIEEREGKYDIRKKGQEYYNRTTIGKFIIKK